MAIIPLTYPAKTAENSKDRPVVEWVSAFLWHWEQSGVLASDAARAIVAEVEKQHLASMQNLPSQMPEPLETLKALESLDGQR